MPDIVSPEIRSRMMAGIGSRNTKPELQVRKALHRLGFRYSLHAKDLPGKPDLKLTRYSAVVFVNGCFWHGHDCPLFRLPGTRTEFWRNKIDGNRQRDQRNHKQLLKMHWRVLDVWECAVRGKDSLDPDEWIRKVTSWLNGNELTLQIRGNAIGTR